MSGAAGAAAASAAAARMNAVRSFGVVVTVEPDEFLAIAKKQKEPLIIMSVGGFFSPEYRYLMSYKGLAFYATSPDELSLPSDSELVRAQKLTIPG